ncbi:MAG: right-handed parallel beta-helix repeat-containing protein [candidate division KSB1 bacterium]|nr:right-handed parallel beta-helix repeat-containing protein [candidate division KSB1 bacterium]MDZ7301589.1 right-handed parallel beta-helix repeat-containing protein [candidate division KSB1 bacterium]MDZ7310995.1 right-handed parallel beta-helix repeat-containing protein [candidate division KSB1 bacterium]
MNNKLLTICVLILAAFTPANHLFANSLIAKPGDNLSAKLSALQPGDTLLLRGGTYNEGLSLPKSGGAGKLLVIRAYPGEKPVISTSNPVLSLNKDYWLIEGLIFDHQQNASDAVPVSGSNNIIRRCEFRNGQRDCFDGKSSSRNNIIENCTIRDFVWSGGDAHGIVLNPGAEGWIIRKNTIYNCSGDCIQLYADDATPITSYSKNITISGNIFYTTLGSSSENALDFKGVDGCTVEANEMYGFANKAWVVQKGCRNITGRYNIIHDSQRGMEFRGEGGKTQENIRLFKNILYNIQAYYAVKFDGVSNVEMANNTIANIKATCLRIEGQGVQGGYFRNNLIYQTDAPSLAATFDCKYDHNGWFGTSPKDLSGTGDRTGSDPRFTNAAAFDFTLQANSPAVDAGVNVGLSFKGAAPDLGAQEFGDVPLTVDDETQGATLPDHFDLLQSYPNPFFLSGANSSLATRIEFEIGENSHVRLEILNVLGQQVRNLLDAEVPAGRHVVVWDGRDNSGAVVASGVYVYRLAGITQTATGRATALNSRPKRATARLLLFNR